MAESGSVGRRNPTRSFDRVRPWRVAAAAATIAAAIVGVMALVSWVGGLDADSRSGQTSVATPVASDASSSEAAPTWSPAAGGLSEEEAVGVARAAGPLAAAGRLANAEAGPLGEVFTARNEFDWSRDLPPDKWVWVIYLVAENEEDGSLVFVDYIDGTVYGIVDGIVN